MGFKDFFLEVAKCSHTNNIIYCRKGNDYIEFGNPGQLTQKELDKNNYWSVLLSDIKTLSIEELESKYPREMVLRRNIIMQIRRDSMLKAVAKNNGYSGELSDKNIWIWGQAGTGKTRWVWNVGAENIYPKPINKWWDGYIPSDHNYVLLDDYPEDGKFLLQHMKTWGDRYPFIGELKGGSVLVNPKNFRLVVTSNHPIEVCFSGAKDEDIAAIKRRFRIVHVKDRNDLFLNTRADPWVN